MENLYLLIVLAPLVGADLGVMDRDAKKMRGARPFVFTQVKSGQGVDEVAAFVERLGGLAPAAQADEAAAEG